ncbi:MFS transporter [Sciscionella sediminilitoris]|uniref:MFS transporter n=1 Tax=Sciscionella sediminilitoris TaxID=1445613 RepID=UPI000692430B|nr:MFS transporter [Sciscionella sp. SE31]
MYTLSRKRVSGAGFRLTAAALFALIAGTEIPTPLYVLYHSRFALSATLLTLVFATYAVALIPALIVFGRFADLFGRRRTLMLGLLAAAAGSLLLAVAPDFGWLLAGRAVQGLAVGTATGAATAALVETEPHGKPHRAAAWATIAVAGGGAGGPLLAGVLAQYAPGPYWLSYAVETVALLGIAAGLLLVRNWPEPPRGTQRYRIRIPAVPVGARRAFARTGLVVFTVWSVGALYTSVVPSYAAALLGTADLAVLGSVPFAMLAIAALTQYLCRTLDENRAQLGGLLLLGCGLAALVLAFPERSVLWLSASAVLDGTGLGLGFLGAQARLNRLAAGNNRAELAAAFNICLYLGVALPVLGVGIVADLSSLFIAVLVFAVVIGCLALLGVLGILRAARTVDLEGAPAPSVRV